MFLRAPGPPQRRAGCRRQSPRSATVQTDMRTDSSGRSDGRASFRTNGWNHWRRHPTVPANMRTAPPRHVGKCSSTRKPERKTTAGLLTSSGRYAFPAPQCQWPRLHDLLTEVTATGIVPDSHRCSLFIRMHCTVHAEPSFPVLTKIRHSSAGTARRDGKSINIL